MPATINVKVLFFASARDAAGGITSVSVDLDSDGADTRALRTKLASLYPKLGSFVRDEENVTLALNEDYLPAGKVRRLNRGDTVALIPPISGG